MYGSPVEACGNATEVFELVEAAFDGVADLVCLEVVGDWTFAGRIAWDHCFSAHIGDQGSQSIGIIGLVSQDPTGRQAFQQGRSKRRVATLTRCQDQLEGSAQPIDGDVDLGGQSTSGTPQSLIPPFWPPPLPVAACWCTRTRLESSET